MKNRQGIIRTGLLSVGLGITLAASAGIPATGTYAVLTARDYNADSLYAATLSGEAKTAVTSDPDYGKGHFGSSLTVHAKVNRWTVYSDGVADSSATGCFPPNAAYDYYVTGKAFSLTTPNDLTYADVYMFPGRSLTLDDATVTHCSKGTSVVNLGTDVRVSGQSSYSFAAFSSADPQTVATATLAAGANQIFSTGHANNPVCGIGWTLKGPSATAVRLMVSTTTKGSVTWNWRGDCSQFSSTLYHQDEKEGGPSMSTLALYAPFAGTVSVAKSGNRVRAASSSATVGTLVVASGAQLVLADSPTRVGSLVLRDGAVIDATDAACAPVQVATDVAVSGDVRVLLPVGARRTILTVPEACAVTVADFTFAPTVDAEPLAAVTADFVASGDGTKSLVVESVPAVARGLGTTLSVTNDTTLVGADDLVQVKVASGATLDYRASSSSAAARMPIHVAAGATLNVGAPWADGWSFRPLLWLDGGAAATLSDIVITYADSCVNYDHAPFLAVGQTVCDEAGHPFVKGWLDCRADQQDVKMGNNRYDATLDGTHNVISACHPRRVRGGLNGMDYLSFDRPSRACVVTNVGDSAATVVQPLSNTALPRLFFSAYASAPEACTENHPLKPRVAFFVYGSQQGGGGALLGGNKNFLRAGTVGAHTKDDAILADNAAGARVWLDGAEVDPTKTGFSGGWQVVTIDFGSTSAAFTGLGYGEQSSEDNGGQAYAEVILVDEELTDRQRQTVEIYLAEKWGLSDRYVCPDDARAAVYGDGTVNLVSDMALSGAFAGVLNLNGHTLTIDGVAPPPTEADIDTTGMTGWYDPEAAGALVRETSSAQKPKSPAERVLWLYDRRASATAMDGLHALTAVTVDRGPWVDASAHGFGSVRNWLDYSNVAYVDWANTAADKIYNGNTLRFRVAQDGTWTGNVVSNAFRTLVMAQDSKYGGGQPFVDGNSVNPSAAATLYKVRAGQTAEAPIYPAGTADVLTKGVTRLDGVPVDGATQGFRGRPEVLSVQPDGAYAPVCFDFISNSERRYGADSRAAVQGEILMWDRKLDAAELETVEAYLSWKWLGLTAPGFVALTDAVVSGAGTVRAASLAVLPRMAADSTATVEVTSARLAFACEKGVLSGAKDLGGARLRLPPACTVEVSFAGSLRAGDYPLVSCGGGLAATTFTLTPSVYRGKELSLVPADGSLVLRVAPRGGLFIIR